MILSPLTLNILWHQDFEKGLSYAELFYKTFTRDIDDTFSRDLGVPIRLGILKDGNIIGVDGKKHKFNYQGYTRTATIILMDVKLVNDTLALQQLNNIANQLRADDNHLLIPIAIEQEVLSASTDLTLLQFIRFYDLPKSRRDNYMLTIVAHELLRLMNDEGCFDKNRAAKNKLKQPSKFFLSHTKKDGQVITKRIREHIHKDFPIYTFFDENDIPIGMSFLDTICEEVQQSAMLAIHTDHFSSSIWCTQELEWAKKYNRPIVIVDMLSKGDMRVYPYFGNVPIIKSTIDNLKDGLNSYQREVKLTTLLMDNIIFTALKECLRSRYHEELSLNLKKEFQMDNLNFRISIHQPELLTFVHLKELAKEKMNNIVSGFIDIDRWENYLPDFFVYPNPPVPIREKQILDEICDNYSNIKFITSTELMLFGDKVAGFFQSVDPTTGLIKPTDLSHLNVSISISNPGQNALANIFIQDMIVELAKQLLHLNVTLVYGGDINFSVKDGFNFTEVLLDIARTYLKKAKPSHENKIINLAPFPFYTLVDEKKIAQHSAIMKFQPVEPDESIVKKEFAKEIITVDNEHTFFAKAHSLSKMRRELIPLADAHILMGGKVRGYFGRYPGVLEEFLFALDPIKEEKLDNPTEPIFLIGGFGGVTTAIRDAIVIDLDKDSEITSTSQEDSYPVEFTYEFQTSYEIQIDGEVHVKEDEKKKAQIAFFNQNISEPEENKIDYDKVKERLISLRADQNFTFFNNGLDRAENIRLMYSTDIYEIIRLILKGLKSIANKTNER